MMETGIDENEIKSLLSRERWARDTCQWQKMRDSWHPDDSKTRIHITWYDGTIEPFVSHSAALASKSVSIMHLIIPADIEIQGSKALAESNGMIMSRFPHEEHDYDMTSWVRFVNQLEKVDGRWKMITLEVIYLRDLITPVPGSPALDFADVKDWPRKSYKFATWHLMHRGLKVSKDLPGEDDEETVNKVLDKARGWLAAD